MKLSPDKKIDVAEVIKDLEHYRPKRKGWQWRKLVAEQQVGPFIYKQSSENLSHSVPLPAAQTSPSPSTQSDVPPPSP